MGNANFSLRLKELMNDRKTTQQELAEVLNITRQQISNYVLGKTSPDPNCICKIAQYFNVSTDYLLGLSDSASSNIDDRRINQILGLSQETIDILRSEMDLLYKVTNKSTPIDAISVFNQFNSFVMEGHKPKDMREYGLSLGMNEIDGKDGEYVGPLSLIGFDCFSDTINAIVEEDCYDYFEDEYEDKPIFSIMSTLSHIIGYKSDGFEKGVVQELVEDKTDGILYPKNKGKSFLIDKNDIFSIYLLRLQEALIRRKNRIFAASQKNANKD